MESGISTRPDRRDRLDRGTKRGETQQQQRDGKWAVKSYSLEFEEEANGGVEDESEQAPQ